MISSISLTDRLTENWHKFQVRKYLRLLDASDPTVWKTNSAEYTVAFQMISRTTARAFKREQRENVGRAIHKVLLNVRLGSSLESHVRTVLDFSRSLPQSLDIHWQEIARKQAIDQGGSCGCIHSPSLTT